MKRYVLLLTLLALLLTACGRQNAKPAEPNPETPPPQSESAGNAVEAAPPAAVVQEYVVEGQAESVEASRYEGNGWAIYIPAEGWRLDDRERDDGVFQTIWESTVNDDAELWVLELGQRTLAEGQTWLQQEEDDYVFQTDKQGGLWGTDAEDRQQMEVRFHEGGGNLYAVVWTYPEAAAEGFGTRLSVMADSFEITKE